MTTVGARSVRAPTVVTFAALLLGLLVVAALAVVPTVQSSRVSVEAPADPAREPVTRIEQRRTTLLSEGGWPRLAFLLFPAAVAAGALAASRTRSPQPARVVAAVLVGLFCVVTGFSVGLLYLPVAGTLAVAALLGASHGADPAGRYTGG